MSTDELIEQLESLSNRNGWVCRFSRRGFGIRIHESDQSQDTLRQAIRKFLDACRNEGLESKSL